MILMLVWFVANWDIVLAAPQLVQNMDQYQLILLWMMLTVMDQKQIFLTVLIELNMIVKVKAPVHLNQTVGEVGIAPIMYGLVRTPDTPGTRSFVQLLVNTVIL